MSAQDLYDLSPLLRLLLVGTLLAGGPLAWVWLRNRRGTPLRRAQVLTLLTLFLTFDLVLFGAFTRLTDSGLGCPDWPGCYGHASPIGASVSIQAAQTAMPTGPVTHGKAWVEMVHRYLASSVGFLILVLAILAWRRWSSDKGKATGSPVSPWWPTLTLIWVCIQGAFGALTVTMKLFPAIVTLHLAGGVILLVLLCIQAVRYTQFESGRPPVGISGGGRALLWMGAILLAVQVLLGGWVSTNYAVLACSEFPRCQGSWWPLMNWQQGFEIWRELGMTGAAEVIGFSALTAIHYAHRLAAYLVLAVLGLLAWYLNRIPALRIQSRWLAGLTGLQLATGLSNVVLDWPLVAAVLHTGGAAALAVTLTWAIAASRVRTSTQALSNLNPSESRFSA
ncbi:heme A synthase [Rhodoferax sp. PAMC 29310]|uniref:COX15/CtaA family protein n=1 Tax=Rhodoferax sp. PAMC 29310 TaxID=2822760 RepID=UPI001B3245EF|nr:COX15/CtaA family protein [Rhodoferax sp. PAMC 29310]